MCQYVLLKSAALFHLQTCVLAAALQVPNNDETIQLRTVVGIVLGIGECPRVFLHRSDIYHLQSFSSWSCSPSLSGTVCAAVRIFREELHRVRAFVRPLSGNNLDQSFVLL